jgi:hypothetical protein
VALPLDDARTIEAQLRGRGEVGGIQIRVHPPRPGRFPEEEPPRPSRGSSRQAGGQWASAPGARLPNVSTPTLMVWIRGIRIPR